MDWVAAGITFVGILALLAVGAIVFIGFGFVKDLFTPTPADEHAPEVKSNVDYPSNYDTLDPFEQSKVITARLAAANKLLDSILEPKTLMTSRAIAVHSTSGRKGVEPRPAIVAQEPQALLDAHTSVSTYSLRERYAARRIAGPIFLVVGILGSLGGAIIGLTNFDLPIGIITCSLLVLGGVGLVIAGHRMVTTPLRWFCPDCGKRLHADEPWKCGFCDADNRHKSFLNKCGNRSCEAPPKTMICKYCCTPMFLDDDNDTRHAARSLYAASAPSQPPPSAQEAADRQRAIDDRRHELEKIDLDIKLKKRRLELDPPKREPVDRQRQRSARLKEQIAMALQDCETIKQCAMSKQKLITEIENDPDYADVKKEVCAVITRTFDAIQYQIESSDVPVY